MSLSFRGYFVLALLAVQLSAIVARADDQKIDVDMLPKAVLDAIKAKYPDAKLLGAEKETQGDKTVYEVTIKNKDRNIELVLSPQGKIIAIEQEIPAKDLPSAVAKAIEKNYPKATIKSAEEELKNDKASYAVVLETEVVIEKDKQKLQVQLTADGKITATQKQIAIKDLPKAVAASLQKKYAKATIKRANESTRDDRVSYAVTLETADKMIVAFVDPDGKIQGDEVQDKKDK
jgi:biopolymer transport protein ExbD